MASASSPDPDRFAGRRVTLFPAAREVEVASAWLHDGRLVLKFDGVDSINDAEALRGAEVCVPLVERQPAGEGEYYFADLVGCRAVDRSGAPLGIVESWQETGGPALLVIRDAQGGEVLVPFVRALCVAIDPAARTIVLDLPEGLKELNAS